MYQVFQRRAYTESVMHKRSPIYGDPTAPKDDLSRACISIAFLNKVSNLVHGCQQLYSIGIPTVPPEVLFISVILSLTRYIPKDAYRRMPKLSDSSEGSAMTNGGQASIGYVVQGMFSTLICMSICVYFLQRRSRTRTDDGGKQHKYVEAGKEPDNMIGRSWYDLAEFSSVALIRNWRGSSSYTGNYGYNILLSSGWVGTLRILLMALTLYTCVRHSDSQEIIVNITENSESCLSNEVQRDNTCLLYTYQSGIPRGATADRYVFMTLACGMLLLSTCVQIGFRVLSNLVSAPYMTESKVVSVSANVSSSYNPLKAIFQSFEIAYDAAATPLRNQWYQDVYTPVNVVEDPQCTEYAHALSGNELVSTDDPDIHEHIVWFRIDERERYQFAIHGNKLVGIIGAIEGSTYQQMRSSTIKPQRGHDMPLTADIARKYCGWNIVQWITTANRVNQYDPDKSYMSIKSLAQSLQIQLRKPQLSPKGRKVPHTFFPWTATSEDLTSYRGRVTNIIALFCVRAWLSVSFYLCSIWDRFPFPFSGLTSSLPAAQVPFLVSPGAGNDALKVNSTSKKATNTPAKCGTWCGGIYQGIFEDPPQLAFIMLGTFFAFQAAWIFASTLLHRLVLSELGYLRALSSDEAVEVKGTSDGSPPMRIYSRFRPWAKLARQRRVTDFTSSYLILAVCIASIAGFSADEDWLEVSIMSTALALTLFYMYLNFMVFRDTLTASNRLEMIEQQGMNEEIEDAAREGEESVVKNLTEDDKASTGLLPLIF